MKLLLIEDDAAIAKMIKRGLESEGYQLVVCRDGTQGFETAIRMPFSAIILDLMLPGMDGMAICEALRSRRQRTPILMLTARGETADRIRGLRHGADDYLAKPFDFDELSARIHALLRRDSIQKGNTIQIDRLTLDTETKQAWVLGEPVGLTPREYSLLEALARNEGRTLTRDVILGSVWQDDDSLSNTVDARILALRKKIDDGFERKLIHTIHRVGYVLRVGELE